MFSKLCRGKATGVQSGSPVLIPWQVMVNIMLLIKGYGGSVETKLKGGSKESCLLSLSTLRIVQEKYITQGDAERTFFLKGNL